MKIKTILLSILLLVSHVNFAHALSWSIKQNTGFDQIIITNNSTKEKLETIRTDTNKILIQSKNFDKNAVLASGNFVTDIIPTEYGLTIQLKNSSFGFIQNQDENGNLTVEIYNDPLGSRWKPTEERKEFSKEVAQKEEKVQVKLEELKKEKQEQLAIQTQINNTPPKTTNIANNEVAKQVLVAEAEQEKAKENSLDKAKTITENDLNHNKQNTAQPKTPATFTPPSVSFKLNNNKPGEAPNITPKDIENSSLQEEASKKSESIANDAKELLQQKPNDLPIVIDDSQYDTFIPKSPEEAGIVEEEKKEEPDPNAPPVGEIVYVDEAGNPVPPPLDIPATIQKMRKAYNLGIYETVLEEAEKLKDLNLPKNLLEEIYYDRAKAFFIINSRNLENAGEKFLALAQEALNISHDSSRRPEVMANLAVTYLALNRPEEARAYTDLLFKNYPYSVDTPNAILLLSDYYLKKGEYSLASQYLQILIDNYPDNTYAKDAALLQIKALYKLGNLDRTMTMIEFTDRRWPKVYLESSDYLMIKAHIQEERQEYKSAIDTYWQIFNLDPKNKNASDILFKIANLYYDMNDKDSAKKVLEQLYKDYPKSKLSPKALLFVGENGRYDGTLDLDETIAIFKQKNPVYPANYYKKIIEEYPDSREAILAKLRLTTQRYLEKDYQKSAQFAQQIFIDNVDKNESKNASELLYRSFDPMLQLALSEQNFERTMQLWEQFPAVHEYYEPINTELRMAMARALLNRNETAQAEEMLEPFLNHIPKNAEEYKDGIYAYDVFLAHAINKQDWNKVLQLNEKIADWQLPRDKELNKLYTTALAAENLGLDARALPIWQTLSTNEEIPLYQRAYAQYFLARDAEKKQNLRGAYQANLDTLAMFEDLRNMQSPYASAERERESIAALMDITEIAGRFTESMQWLNRYRSYVSTKSEDYAGLQLREARLHRKMGDTSRWRSILEEVKKREPDSVYGKMASSELTTFEMARDLNRFTGN